MLQDLFGKLADDASQKISDTLGNTPLDNVNETLQNTQEATGDIATTATEKLKELTPDSMDGLVDTIADQFGNKK
jgi:hypothetical protein